MKKIGFTLAEVMIVLVVIGVITGILLPTAIQSTPDKNVMKFKKGYNTLGQVIRELVTSDKYYKDGDLAVRANGEQITGENNGDITYFCETFADVLNIRKKNCSEAKTIDGLFLRFIDNGTENPPHELSLLDFHCKTQETIIGAEIITSDNITFFQVAPNATYGYKFDSAGVEQLRIFCMPGKYDPNVCRYVNKKTNSPYYSKIFCMDIDGVGKGEDPFGFGINADGKIFIGARAQEWINKSIQKED